MLIKRDGVALAHAEIMRVVGSDGCITITANAIPPEKHRGAPDRPTTFVITLLQHEVIELARAYDLMLSETATA